MQSDSHLRNTSAPRKDMAVHLCRGSGSFELGMFVGAGEGGRRKGSLMMRQQAEVVVVGRSGRDGRSVNGKFNNRLSSGSRLGWAV